MTRDEALKKWKEEVADWKIASGFDRNMKVSYYAMSTFVRILDALIAPEETEKSIDDRWKPWPPKEWELIKHGDFEVTVSKLNIWKGSCTDGYITLDQCTPINLIRWWRQV